MVAIPRVQDLNGVYLIDGRHLGIHGSIGSYVLPGPQGAFALIETGPATCLAALEQGLRDAGFDPAKLGGALVTHIHLDHAGAAGTLARSYGARVYVHEAGAPHLADPTRLLASAGRLYGEKMTTLWGKVEPVPEGQLSALQGGDRFELFGHRIEVIHTPGHASSHVSYLLDGTSLFTGDSAAIKLPGSKVVKPATAPPEIDLEEWDASLERMLRAEPERLLLSHFGEVKDVAGHLQAVRERTHYWAEVVLEGLRAGKDERALIRRITELGDAELAADGASPDTFERYHLTSDYELTVLGLTRYWHKVHPERLER